MPVRRCYALKTMQMRVTFLCRATVFQTELFVTFANLLAFFCARSNAFICPSLYGSMHEAPYSRIGRTSDIPARLLVLLFPFFENTHYEMKCLPGFCTVWLTWSAQLKSLCRIILNICSGSLPELFGHRPPTPSKKKKQFWGSFTRVKLIA